MMAQELEFLPVTWETLALSLVPSFDFDLT